MRRLQTAECPDFGREAIVRLFDTAYAELTARLCHGMAFLIDFHGRDLLKAFRDWLASRKIRCPTETHRADTRGCPALRRESHDYGTDDFLDLANGVRSLAGLAPLP